ncbi:MAG: nicotinate-nucleotide--dimethylbenzimidazole phosphoribosyltransferase [Magnetococcales bacterium]|nr:nicotinate-nucleotide--dimethylbenzimidazole phosphoribosyltransferase [Magnetococcales bacterium]
MTHDWLLQPIPAPVLEIQAQAEYRQGQLTKPAGSLGRMEEIAVRLAALQNNLLPSLDRVRIVVFAADHGVAAAGVSAFPQSVTVEMIRNFSRGGAAIAVLARQLEAGFEVVDVGAVTDPAPLPHLVSCRVGPGTADFRFQPAMTAAQCAQALQAGREAVERGVAQGVQLLIGGEMGIGNTTAATAVLAALLNLAPAVLAGPGTGLTAEGVTHKVQVIETALRQHQGLLEDPLAVLAALGGFEMVALSGFYIAAAQRRIPLLVDGFIATAAAVAALRIQPDLRPWLFFSHTSAEPGQQAIMAALGIRPLLDLGLRLGEGSGAAIALPILRLACALHRQMATFAEAAVSGAH